MANHLGHEKKLAVIGMLCEGCSVRSIERLTGVHRDTILRLMVRVGEHCRSLQDEHIRGLACESIEVDEVWSFVAKKQRNVTVADPQDEYGDQFVFTAIDAQTKLIASYCVGKRITPNVDRLMRDLAQRVIGRVQISTDGFKPYPFSVSGAFRDRADHAVIVKNYATTPIGPGRYSPPVVTSVTVTPMRGRPRPELSCTSHVERSNLTIRMHSRRLTRLTNAFSKKLDNLRAALDLFFAWYNFVRPHQSLKMTPAMAAGITQERWTIADLLPSN